MKIAWLFSASAALALSLACASPGPAVPKDGGSGARFVLDLKPGAYYRTTTGWFIFRTPVYPQVAAWVESTDGRYLGTIFVTAKAERNGWLAAPARGRPEALPVWSHRRQGKLDAVSGATSAGATSRASGLAAELPAGRYVVMLETNRSYDYNATYTRENSGVCGQPSIVYRADIELGAGPAQSEFRPIGTGSVDGSDGAIRDGLAGIDTALELFSSMTVSIGVY